MNLYKRLIIVLCLCVSASVFGHGDLHERILAVTEEIKKAPDSAFLYFKRGKLLFQHDDYESSIKDLEKSSKLGYNDIEQDLLFSKNYYEVGLYENALDKINALLQDDSHNVVFLKIKGRIYMKQEQYEMAANSFESVITYSSKTFPENYIECANAWVLTKVDSGFNKAIKILETGIDNLGNVISLLEEKISIQYNHANYELAIEDQKQIIKILNRKEHAYFDLARLYFANGDLDACKEALQNSNESVNDLPDRIKNTQNIRDLVSDINKLQSNLN
ncbi:tetratricopeptide repeat protein [Hanstruepera ponticola]|uniref:tetratricopeptide repeat protein n=1 Tax=Hanstruepera ponticola TaxID=2042995 RepID=UPI000EB5E6FA|nr:hypothetical protein [Hanstruepera ponticola]